jgi:hypothetical protein
MGIRPRAVLAFGATLALAFVRVFRTAFFVFEVFVFAVFAFPAFVRFAFAFFAFFAMTHPSRLQFSGRSYTLKIAIYGRRLFLSPFATANPIEDDRAEFAAAGPGTHLPVSDDWLVGPSVISRS